MFNYNDMNNKPLFKSYYYDNIQQKMITSKTVKIKGKKLFYNS